MKPNLNNLRERATALRLHGILKHWSETASADWLPGFIQWEEEARDQRSLDRRASVVSRRWQTSTGTGPRSVTAVPSKG